MIIHSKLLHFVSVVLFCFSCLDSFACFSSDEDALLYHKHSTLQFDWACESIDRIVFAFGERILDVGCGDGKVTKYVAQKAENALIVGLDKSPAMIKLATQIQDKTNVLFMQANIENEHFEAQFDRVVSFCCLHWLKDQTKALQSIYKSLVSGGQLLLVLPAKSETNVSLLAETLCRSEAWNESFKEFINARSYYSSQEYQNLLQQIGFKSERMCEIDTLINFGTYEELKNWICAISPHVKYLSQESLRNEFLQELATLVLARAVKHTESVLVISAKKLEVIAVK